MILPRTLAMISCGCLAATVTLRAEDPKCPRGYQPYANRCITQRMADYISCVEATGANQQKVALEVSNARADEFSAGAKGSGSGVVARGSGSLVVDKSAERALAQKFEKTWGSDALVECRKVLAPERNTGTGAAKPEPGTNKGPAPAKPQEPSKQKEESHSEPSSEPANKPALQSTGPSNEKSASSPTRGAIDAPNGEPVTRSRVTAHYEAKLYENLGPVGSTITGQAAQTNEQPKPTESNGKSMSPVPAETADEILEKIRGVLEKDRESGDLQGCPAGKGVELRRVGDDISYYVCVKQCFAEWKTFRPKNLDFQGVRVSQPYGEPDLAIIEIPCLEAAQWGLCVFDEQGTFPASTACLNKKKVKDDYRKSFAMVVHAENVDSVVSLWKEYAHVGQ